MRKAVFLMLALLCVAAAVWMIGLLVYAARMPREAHADRQADAIVIITGGSLRVQEGLDLLLQGKARHLFISGVGEGVTKVDIAHLHPDPAAVRAHFGEMTLGYDARDTAGNAMEVAGWAASIGVRSLYLVTAFYHVPRAMQEFHRQMPDVEVLAYPVFPSAVSSARWWMNPGSLALVAAEYQKYLVRWGLYRFGGASSDDPLPGAA